jgi:signal transduction histidine kinase
VEQTEAPAEDLYEDFTRIYNDFATLQREVARQNAELKRLHAEMYRLLGMAAHDLRNPHASHGSLRCPFWGIARDV